MRDSCLFRPKLLRGWAWFGVEVAMVFRNLMFYLLLLLASMEVAAQPDQSPKVGWLVGTWVLCEDPDNSPKDSLQFNGDGTGMVIRAKGSIEFLHRHSGRSVSLLANANGYAIPIALSASPAYDQLLLHSDKTGNTASYVRADSRQVSGCGIQ